MTSSTKVLWRVQVRKSRAHKWVNKGLFETRNKARGTCLYMRDFFWVDMKTNRRGYGFGNTRVVRYQKGEK